MEPNPLIYNKILPTLSKEYGKFNLEKFLHKKLTIKLFHQTLIRNSYNVGRVIKEFTLEEILKNKIYKSVI